MAYILTPNQQLNGIYTGMAYVFDTSGGFSINQSFPGINLNTSTPVAQYDVTEAIQIQFNVRTLNNKIGVIKDQNNDKVIQVVYYDPSGNILVDFNGVPIDSVTITAAELLAGVTSANILSMGKMSSLYSDFNYTVMEYFGAPYGFSNLFSSVDNFDINNGKFNPTDFINLINGITFDGITGSVISDLTGYFTVNDLNSHLHYICATNVFGNRPYSGNFNITDGFVEGDLIYVPRGISITLSIDIEPETNTITNTGPTNLQEVNNIVNYNNNYNYVSKNTTSTLTNITQTYSVPILFVLTNEDPFSYTHYCKEWKDVGSQFGIGKMNWLSVSISSVGTYQSAVDDQGHIYVSNDYGQTWNFSFNMGASSYNSIGVSQDGRYQTASNGFEIFVSNNYGSTWNSVYTLGSSNIFVSVSLSGKYQTILSCGDSLYTSNDYGATWNRLSDINSELYNDIETFPTGGVSLSFTGQYQSIACGNLWLSNDYGETWKVVATSDPFDEHNWDSISISSNGKIQTAVDSGGYIYNSQDYGATWYPIVSLNALNRVWEGISISADATYQTAIEYDGAVYFSLDYGTTWEMSSAPNMMKGKWTSVSVSANGQYQTIVEYGGTIYTSNLS